MSNSDTNFFGNINTMMDLVRVIKVDFEDELTENKNILERIRKLRPNKLRKEMHKIERRIDMHNRFDVFILGEMMNISNKLNEMINTMNENDKLARNDMSIVINNAKVGTLQGLARDVMERENLHPHPDDERAIQFLQDWDEQDRMKHGGKSKRRKMKKLKKTRKTKKTIKTRKTKKTRNTKKTRKTRK